MKAYINIAEDICKGCEICINACPENTISIAKEPNAKGYYPAKQHNTLDCTGCRKCALMCPEVAIEVLLEK